MSSTVPVFCCVCCNVFPCPAFKLDLKLSSLRERKTTIGLGQSLVWGSDKFGEWMSMCAHIEHLTKQKEKELALLEKRLAEPTLKQPQRQRNEELAHFLRAELGIKLEEE